MIPVAGKMNTIAFFSICGRFVGGIVCVALLFGTYSHAADLQTMLVSAEGLADPAAEKYRRDKELMIDALRQDARRQAVEKAVGAFVDSNTLVENYQVISDRVLTRSSGLIKRVVKESSPWKGEDDLMHLLLKAEVYLAGVQEALKEMSKEQRLVLIKEGGNPRIAVEVVARDAARGNGATSERSQLAENILKERFSRFGYRVWSRGDSAAEKRAGGVDFLVKGEAKFKKLSVRLKASGITISKYALTSWTVACKDLHTGEEIFFTNRIPRKKSWPDEDAALEDIGRLIADSFNAGFFEYHLMKPSRIFQMRVDGLPDYDSGILLKRELIGLRHILNVDFRSFSADGGSHFEVEFVGKSDHFMRLVNNAIIHPLNRKLGKNAFKIVEISGETLRLGYRGDKAAVFKKKLDTNVPAGLADAPAERIAAIVHDPGLMKKVARVNPEGVKELAGKGNAVAKQAVASF